jgi:hypothetical protein
VAGSELRTTFIALESSRVETALLSGGDDLPIRNDWLEVFANIRHVVLHSRRALLEDAHAIT